MTCSALIGKFTRVFLAASISLASFSVSPQAAEASDVSDDTQHQAAISNPIDAYAQKEGISSEQVFYQAAKELEASSLKREIDPSGTHYVYHIADGSALSFPTTAEFENRMSAGFENGQIWLELTPFEQKLAAGGGLGGVAAAVCLAGPAACVVGGVIAGGLVTYVGERGVCPNDQRMTLYFTRSGSLSWGRCGGK